MPLSVHLEIFKMASYIFVFCYSFLEATIGHQQSGGLRKLQTLVPLQEKKKKTLHSSSVKQKF